jgi:hypothetical protein
MNEIDRTRRVPLIVSSALFMQNLDSTVIATALPTTPVETVNVKPLSVVWFETTYKFTTCG